MSIYLGLDPTGTVVTENEDPSMTDARLVNSFAM
jgi:hypothetical protein